MTITKWNQLLVQINIYKNIILFAFELLRSLALLSHFFIASSASLLLIAKLFFSDTAAEDIKTLVTGNRL